MDNREAARRQFGFLFKMIQTMTRDELVRSHYNLAMCVARKFAKTVGRVESLDDLTQVALLGLVRAADRFDPFRGVSFAPFATSTMVGELKHYLRDRSSMVRPPRRLQNLYLQLPDAVAELSQQLGRSPTVVEISQRLDATNQEAAAAIEVRTLRRLVSLDAAHETKSQRRPESSEDPEIELVEARLDVTALLKHLPPRQRRVVRLRFIGGLTQPEIATRMHLSQAHVQRLLTRSLDQLRSLAAAS